MGFFFWGQTGHFAALKRPPANLEFEDCGYEIGKLVSLSTRAPLTLSRTSIREPREGGCEIAIHLHCFCFGSPCGSQNSLPSHTTSFSVSFLPLISSRISKRRNLEKRLPKNVRSFLGRHSPRHCLTSSARFPPSPGAGSFSRTAAGNRAY